jgi:hypothetical protein
MRGGNESRQGGLAQSQYVQPRSQSPYHIDDVGDVPFEIECALVESDMTRVDPIGDKDLEGGEQPDDKVTQQDGKVT